MLLVFSMTLAISCKVLFFILTTPFCYRVLGPENSCSRPLFPHIFSNKDFSNSLSCSFLILLIFKGLLLCSLYIICHNSSNASHLVMRKFTQVNLEKSSTHTYIYIYIYIYLFPTMLYTCMGPIRSMWTNSSTLVVEPS